MDMDGYIDEACGGVDCDDADPQVHPGTYEICDGKDTDCDGTVPWIERDADEDGWMYCEGECDDTDPAVNPGVEEVCDNGIDDDCDQFMDLLDPDCELTFWLDAYYWSNKLHLDFTLGTSVPTTWTTLMILISPTFQVIPLWTIPMPVIDPPIVLPTISFPFPSVGLVGIWTGLFTEEGVQATYLKWAYTG